MRTSPFAVIVRRLRRTVLVLTVGASLFGPTSLHAQPKPTASLPTPTAPASQAPVTAAPVDEATVFFKQAIAADDAGKPAEAEELFLKAWALKKTWDIAANLGLVESRLGKHAAAAEHLAFAARLVPPTEPARTTAELAKQLEAVRAQVCAVNVRVNLDGAQVRVAGEIKGTTPLERDLFVTPGTVMIEVSKDGYETAAKRIEATKGGTQQVTLNLQPAAAPSTGPRKEIVVAGAVITGAALIAGGVFAGLSASKAGEAGAKGGWDRCYDGSPPSPDCSALHSLRTDAATFGNTSAWMFIGGAAVGGATLAYALIAGRAGTPEKAAVLVVPFAGERGAGLSIQGRF